MSLYKIPFILTLAYAFHFAGSPPVRYRPSQVKEIQHDAIKRSMYEIPLAAVGPILKYLFWAESIIEVTSIIFLAQSQRQEILTVPRFRVISPHSYICQLSLPLTPTYIAGWTLGIIGAVIRRQCYRCLGNMFTFQIAIQKGHRLITTGPYAVVRHPGYAAFICLVCGVVVTRLQKMPIPFYPRGECSASWLESATRWYTFAFVATMLSGLNSLIKRAQVEDDMLKNEFGDEWILWSRKVSSKFIPFTW